MKNFKTYLLTAVAALILVTTFTSCTKDEAGVFNPKKKKKFTQYLDEEFPTIPDELRFKLGIVESKLYKIAKLMKQYQIQAD